MVAGSAMGMVQANVGQKLLICDNIRVLFDDQFLLFNATSCEFNAIHKSIVIMLFCYIDPPHANITSSY